jgi:GntR family transcriptional regulator
MLFRSNPASAVPVYLQLIEQVKHAIDVGALNPGDQLPAIRRVAEELVINPNTVAKAYRELEHEGVIELRQGSGAFVSENGRAGRVARVRTAQPVLQAALERLTAAGLTLEEIRRMFEAELLRLSDRPRTRKP